MENMDSPEQKAERHENTPQVVTFVFRENDRWATLMPIISEELENRGIHINIKRVSKEADNNEARRISEEYIRSLEKTGLVFTDYTCENTKTQVNLDRMDYYYGYPEVKGDVFTKEQQESFEKWIGGNLLKDYESLLSAGFKFDRVEIVPAMLYDHLPNRYYFGDEAPYEVDYEKEAKASLSIANAIKDVFKAAGHNAVVDDFLTKGKIRSSAPEVENIYKKMCDPEDTTLFIIDNHLDNMSGYSDIRYQKTKTLIKEGKMQGNHYLFISNPTSFDAASNIENPLNRHNKRAQERFIEILKKVVGF